MTSTKKILIIDDEPDAIEYLKAILEGTEYQALTAANGEQGLERAQCEPPDLILLDLMMPGGSGTRFLNEIKRHETLRRIPIVVQSGARQATGVDMRAYLDSQPFRGRKEQALGGSPDTRPQAFLEKPVSPAELLETIGRLI